MPNNNDLEMIQLALDGEASEEEQAQLRQALATSADTRATYDALRDLVRQLDSVPLVDAPPMRDTVLSRLRPAPVTPFHSRRRMILGLAYAAAAVIVIGVAVKRFVPPPHTAAATMARLDTADWPVVVRASSSEATITIRGNGDQYVLEATVSGDGPFTLEWDGKKLSPPAGSVTFQNRGKPFELQLQRRHGVSGAAVIRLRLPEREIVKTAIDLR